jgi:hypothetical protein
MGSRAIKPEPVTKEFSCFQLATNFPAWAPIIWHDTRERKLLGSPVEKAHPRAENDAGGCDSKRCNGLERADQNGPEAAKHFFGHPAHGDLRMQPLPSARSSVGNIRRSTL